MRKHILFIAILFLAFVLFGCENAKVEPSGGDPVVDPPIVDPKTEVEEDILPEEILIGNMVKRLTVGDVAYLDASLLPLEATDKEIEYFSSNEDILTVEGGKVTAKASGTAQVTIRAKAAPSIKVSFDIEVSEKVLPDIILPQASVTIQVGDTYKIEYNTVNSSEKVTFKTNDLDYINLDKNGIVTAFEVGTAKVTLTLEDVVKEFTINIIEREKTSEELINEVIKQITIPNVTSDDIDLPTIINGVMIDWTSGNRTLLSDKGEVFYTDSIVLVKLYATFTHGDVDIDKTYGVNIKPWSNEKRLSKVMESITIDSVVTTNLTLSTSYNYGVSATWTSSRSDVISQNGVVNFKENEIDVILKVKLTVGESSMEKEFTVKTIASKKMNLHYFVERANEFSSTNLHNLELKDGKIVLKKGEVYGYYDSSIYETLNFYELVGSWAAVTSKTATAELLVKVKVGNNWSKYFTYGIWGLGRNNLYYNQNDTMAKMDTDEILVSTKDGCAFQYRIVLRRDNEKVDSPVLSLVAITMRLTDENYKYDVDTSKLPDFVDYDVPKVNQNVVPEIGGVICSATTSTMLLKWKGLDFSKYDQYENRYIANLVADRGHNNPTYGNWVYNTAVIGAYGFDSYVRHMVSWDELKYHLATVGPIGASVKGDIGGVYTTGGHLLVVRGYKVVNGQTIVICNDPNINSRFGNDKDGNPLFVYYEFPLNTFLNFWRKTAYIIE